jgi:hypothetical protein
MTLSCLNGIGLSSDPRLQEGLAVDGQQVRFARIVEDEAISLVDVSRDFTERNGGGA